MVKAIFALSGKVYKIFTVEICMTLTFSHRSVGKVCLLAGSMFVRPPANTPFLRNGVKMCQKINDRAYQNDYNLLL